MAAWTVVIRQLEAGWDCYRPTSRALWENNGCRVHRIKAHRVRPIGSAPRATYFDVPIQINCRFPSGGGWYSRDTTRGITTLKA